MREEVLIHFAPGQEIAIGLGSGAMTSADARAWLDEQFVREECAPLRASGKVLNADKVLAIAAAVGRARFEGDAAWAQAFARAAAGALGKDTLRIDLAALTLTY